MIRIKIEEIAGYWVLGIQEWAVWWAVWWKGLLAVW